MARTTLTRELLERLLAGDLDAERRLFEEMRGALVQKARRHPITGRLQPAVSAEDVVQEVFWRSISAGLLVRFEDRGRGSLEAMLTTVLERTLKDLSRRARAQKRGDGRAPLSISSDDVAGRLWVSPGSGAGTPTSGARAEDLTAFCRAQLTERDWHVWRALELEGRSTDSVAEELGTTNAAVRSRLFRARRKLVLALRREGAYGGDGG